MNASELYQAGRLDDAVAAAADEVKKHPADVNRRGLLAELLLFAGELERADKHLEAMRHQDPQTAVGISMFRQLIRAATAREQFFTEGRLPEFVGKPGERLQLHLQASISLREGDAAKAAELLKQAEESRAVVPGTSPDGPFDDLRDLDDLTAPVFEVLTSTGKYYWIPMERVELIEFRAPARPRDLVWRRAHMVVAGGPDGEVFLPTLYAGSHAAEDVQLRLGRSTDWQGGDGSPVRGVGQRMFLVGSEARGILSLEQLTFTNPESPKEETEDADV